MFTIYQIKNSSFFKKNIFHYISIKNSTKIFSKSVTVIVSKDNLKPLSLFDVIFSGTIIPLVGDKREVWPTLSIYLLLEP